MCIRDRYKYPFGDKLSDTKFLVQSSKQMKEFCCDSLCPKAIKQLCSDNKYLTCLSMMFIKTYLKKVDKIEAILLNLDKKFNERR